MLGDITLELLKLMKRVSKNISEILIYFFAPVALNIYFVIVRKQYSLVYP